MERQRTAVAVDAVGGLLDDDLLREGDDRWVGHGVDERLDGDEAGGGAQPLGQSEDEVEVVLQDGERGGVLAVVPAPRAPAVVAHDGGGDGEQVRRRKVPVVIDEALEPDDEELDEQPRDVRKVLSDI